MREMLDDFKRHDQIETAIGMRQRFARRLFETKIRQRVIRARIFDRVLRRIDSHPGQRRARQFRRAVARAAACIQRALAPRQPGRERIARHVLVEEVDIHLAGNHPLTRKFSHGASPMASRIRPRLRMRRECAR